MNATIWYVDNKVKVQSVEDFRNAPDVGVICIMYRYQRDDGRGMGATILSNSEWYWYTNNEGFGKSIGADAWTGDVPPLGAIAKRAPAEMIPAEEYETIIDAAMAEG